jgi:hypothetical protein
LKILKILMPTVEDAEMATISDTHKHPNPENPDNTRPEGLEPSTFGFGDQRSTN